MELLGMIERTVWIDAPPERVWDAITTPEQIGQWFSPGRWELSALEVGGALRWHIDEASVETHIIQVVEPPTRLVYRWEPAAPELPLLTSFLLTEENGGTRLTLTETGYERLPDEVREKRMASTLQGYTEVLADLKTLIEQEDEN